jgi:hypothetical protein
VVLQSYYVFSKGLTNLPVSNQTQGGNWTTQRNHNEDRQVSPFDVRHAWQNTGTYDLPIGRSRLVKLNNRVLDSLLGGWTWGNILTLRTSTPIRLVNGGVFNTVNENESGVILAPGVTLDQIQSMMTNSQALNTNRQSFDPQLIAADGRANPQYFITPTTPGQFGYHVFLYGKNVFSWDSSITKNFRINERARLVVWAGASNILNHPEWGVPGQNGGAGTSMNIQSTTFGIVGGPFNGSRRMQFRASVNF